MNTYYKNGFLIRENLNQDGPQCGSIVVRVEDEGKGRWVHETFEPNEWENKEILGLWFDDAMEFLEEWI